MLKWPKKRGSVFTLLLRNYIIFTIALVLALCTLFALLLYQGYKNFIDIDLRQIENNRDYLIEGNYDEFPIDRLLGEKGFIAVLDDSGKVVYNGGNLNVELSEDELSYIPEYAFLGDVSVVKLPTADNGINYQISYSPPGNELSESKEVYILDENYHLIYSSGRYIKNDLTKKEFKLLLQDYYNNYYVSKYAFKKDDGKPYTLLLFQMQDRGDIIFARVQKTLSVSAILFIIVYCTMIKCFILWLKHKITKPLHLLCDHLNNFDLQTKVLPSYKGPKEFQAIFESFSTMATRLESSETERKNLESNKQSMLADITHDLKTPITVVQGYAKALSDGVIPENQQKKYIDTITLKADELNQLINNFYEYNKLEHPSYELTLERTDICNYLRDYVAEKYSEIESAGFLQDVKIPEKHYHCDVDQMMLKRAFENIVGNAVRHNPEGTTLSFKLFLREDNVIIMLADNGRGISEELSKDVFSPFVMGDSSRQGTGSGLGLSIAKRIVEAHNGEITLMQDNNSQYKTAFEITLPQSKESN